MGTETLQNVPYLHNIVFCRVKLNNPQMGTETRIQEIHIYTN